MKPAINTDYIKSSGKPETYLRQIAVAGFANIHWCHHWSGDFLYSAAEIRQIHNWLKMYHLQMQDLHASDGEEKQWTAAEEYARQAGVELVRNRIDMLSELGGHVIVLHAKAPEGDCGSFREQARRSLDELLPYAQQRKIKIALENVGIWTEVQALLNDYPSEHLGFCYDSGHGNLKIGWGGLDALTSMQQRLLAVHLHDNDGQTDLHQLPFAGTSDWEQILPLIASSSYSGCVTLEVVIRNSGVQDESVFLAQAYQCAIKIINQIQTLRS